MLGSLLGANVLTGVVIVVGTIIALGLFRDVIVIGFRVVMSWIGISRDPNITFGRLDVDPSTNPHPAFKNWHHLQCVNSANTGLRAFLAKTIDAQMCRVSIEFKPNFGSEPSKTDAGIFTLGARSETVTTLFVEKPVVIPIYWISRAESRQNIFYGESGLASRPGHYMTGETFIHHRELRDRWKLDPGIYELLVTVTWNRQPFVYRAEITVPNSEV